MIFEAVFFLEKHNFEISNLKNVKFEKQDYCYKCWQGRPTRINPDRGIYGKDGTLNPKPKYVKPDKNQKNPKPKPNLDFDFLKT